MLSIKNLNKAFEKNVICDFSYHFTSPGLYVIRGASGCGKTTLLRLIASLEKADGGEILWEKEPQISFAFQEARLLPQLNLMDNILLVKEKKDKEKALQILKDLGLSEDDKKYPGALSGGMKLRASLARSLYYGGDVFLWDEPTKELDGDNRKVVLEILEKISKEALVIVATHDEEILGKEEIAL